MVQITIRFNEQKELERFVSNYAVLLQNTNVNKSVLVATTNPDNVSGIIKVLPDYDCKDEVSIYL